jgi:putative redox protein
VSSSEERFASGDIELAGTLARPPRSGRAPGLVLCHGFPAGSTGAALAGQSYVELADRIAERMGWMALAFNYRGCGESEGQFSLAGWQADVVAAIAHLRSVDQVDGVWVVGFGTGGALAIAAAATDVEVRGVASVGTPADFRDWAANPRRLLLYARSLGAIRGDDFPADFDGWSAELKAVSAVRSAANVAPRPLLIVHGTEDELVPSLDARAIAEAHGSAELSMVHSGGHRLRFDPRAIAVVLGWLDRQSHGLAN